MKVEPISEIGGYKADSLDVSYNEIVKVLGKPNATELDDPDKVKAAWGFQDDKGRKGFIWCYKEDNPTECHTGQ